MILQNSRETKRSRAETLADFFLRNPDVWIDGRRLAEFAGNYAWRTRISDVRRAPFNLPIQNRQRRVRTAHGSTVTISEYRYALTATVAGEVG
jgi:hypothetical protein